jgi:tRNA-dihydrouridine synthase
MEGITGHVFRRVHAECFGVLDRYYSPFIKSPRVGSDFVKRNVRELCPGEAAEPRLVPQLLTKNADEFVWAAGLLAKMGFDEVNLNLGCPSRTVTSRGRVRGF